MVPASCSVACDEEQQSFYQTKDKTHLCALWQKFPEHIDTVRGTGRVVAQGAEKHTQEERHARQRYALL